MDTVKSNNTNEVEDEKPHSQLNKIIEADIRQDEVMIKSADSLEKDEVPEIVNIYDYIYGNVQNKLDFYEEKCTENRRASVIDFEGVMSRSRKASLDIEASGVRSRKASVDIDGGTFRSRTASVEERRQSLTRPLSVDIERRRSIRKSSNGIRKSFSLSDTTLSAENAFPSSTETSPTPVIENPGHFINNFKLLEQEEISSVDAINGIAETNAVDATNNNEFSSNFQCIECEKHLYGDDRIEVLTEINVQLKVELEDVHENLKKEASRANDLNTKIMNIENILEKYYKENKNSKNHFGTLYTAMKDYVVEQKYDYTYKRIKSIANYIENLKTTLDNQDKLIKNSFLENPYSTDLMVKHAFLRKQLDEMSKENEYLKEELTIKTTESIDMMKELNRQKFEIQSKLTEVEKQRESENAANDDLIRKLRLRHDQQVQDLQALLKSKDQDKIDMKKKCEATINNYIKENSILYDKLRQQTKV